MIGYKAVIFNDNGSWAWCIAQLEIPEDAIIAHSGNGFYRTDKCKVIRLSPSLYKLAFNHIRAWSWFDPKVEYAVGETVMSEIDTNPHTDCAKGIHFVGTYEQAVGFGRANFGLSAQR